MSGKSSISLEDYFSMFLPHILFLMTSTATSILAIHCYGEKLEVAAFITRSMSKIVNQFDLDLFVFDFHFLLHNSTQAY